MSRGNPSGGRLPRGSKTKESSFASLDFMRGWSAFAVLFSHTSNGVGNSGPGFVWGSFAVDVFMLISGFLMMWHYYERQKVGENWTNHRTCQKFYIRRFFRIAPLYYSVLIGAYIFGGELRKISGYNMAALNIPSAGVSPHNPTVSDLSFAQLISHFTFTFGFIPSLAASTPIPDWSIGLEMQFYLFFPFIALLLVRSRFIGGVLLIMGINWLSLHLFGVGAAAEPKLLGVFPYPTFLPLKIDNFLAGMLIAAGLFEENNRRKRVLLVLLGLLVAICYMKKFFLVCLLFSAYELAVACGTGLPLLDRLVYSLRKFLEHGLFKFMADTSYGVYLLHLLFLPLTVRFLVNFSSYVGLPSSQHFYWALVVLTPFVYSVAYLAHKHIERPGIAWGRDLVKRLGPPAEIHCRVRPPPQAFTSFSKSTPRRSRTP